MNLPSAAPQPGLAWFAEQGLGFFDTVEGHNGDSIYNAEYFANYEKMGDTDVGKRITTARLDLVNRFWRMGPLIDVGVGALAFVNARDLLCDGLTYGWDVNPIAVRKLEERDLLLDPELLTPEPEGKPFALTFWDVLEHIKEPDRMLRNARWVFCSMPIYEGPEHVLRSKHFKPREHCWYFTRKGLIDFMAQRGFTCREHNTNESLLGREDIGSFAFERVPATSVRWVAP
jgi:hypothetical protein